jgi:hypothetical protein
MGTGNKKKTTMMPQMLWWIDYNCWAEKTQNQMLIHTNIVVWSFYHLRKLENMAIFVPCFQLHSHAQPHLPTKPKFLWTQTSFFHLWGILTDLAIAWSKQTVMGLSLLAGTKAFSFLTSSIITFNSQSK